MSILFYKNSVTSARVEEFRRELHHLLWLRPFVNGGTFDPGWSCRDHAFILWCVLVALNTRASMTVGKCMFVAGGDGVTPPVGLGQEPNSLASHAWLELPNGSLFDLSPNLAISHKQWRPIRFGGIEGRPTDSELPSAVIVTRDIRAYEDEINRATWKPAQLTAIYWRDDTVAIDNTGLSDAFTWVNSPLTDWLRQKFRSDIYLKAAVHLIGVLNGERRVLAGVSRNKAWQFVSQIDRVATEQLLGTLRHKQV